ncbi:hypothetical protein EYF80_025844 [Liparis tanakae]|uniref:Uncharacterized protein n=1 Tax=Liparis tanakae TaxID=230148 RepID=A0A4Z2HE76_9TELE|nr:hypothetical protein EYF80_025844 [Liparis tanakae]
MLQSKFPIVIECEPACNRNMRAAKNIPRNSSALPHNYLLTSYTDNNNNNNNNNQKVNFPLRMWSDRKLGDKLVEFTGKPEDKPFGSRRDENTVTKKWITEQQNIVVMSSLSSPVGSGPGHCVFSREDSPDCDLKVRPQVMTSVCGHSGSEDEDDVPGVLMWPFVTLDTTAQRSLAENRIGSRKHQLQT